MPIRVGTCGWQYDDWRTAFYPQDVPTKRWLSAYSQTFDTVRTGVRPCVARRKKKGRPVRAALKVSSFWEDLQKTV